MGLFGFFKKKEVSEETRQGFLNKLLTKYFEGSKAKLGADAADLLELTKYEITPGESMMSVGCSSNLAHLRLEPPITVARPIVSSCEIPFYL